MVGSNRIKGHLREGKGVLKGSVRYRQNSKLRDAIIPTPCQRGVDGKETKTGTPYWNSAMAWQYVETMSGSLFIFLFHCS